MDFQLYFVNGKQKQHIVDFYMALPEWERLNEEGIIQLRVVEATGAEKFAEYIFNKINNFVLEETEGRVKVTKVKFAEHGKNAAYYVA